MASYASSCSKDLLAIAWSLETSNRTSSSRQFSLIAALDVLTVLLFYKTILLSSKHGIYPKNISCQHVLYEQHHEGSQSQLVLKFWQGICCTNSQTNTLQLLYLCRMPAQRLSSSLLSYQNLLLGPILCYLQGCQVVQQFLQRDLGQLLIVAVRHGVMLHVVRVLVDGDLRPQLRILFQLL